MDSFLSTLLTVISLQKYKLSVKLMYKPDPYVIAGQGTIGVEILRQIKQDRLDAIFVCCGGGGMLAGIAAFVKRIRPEVRVIGVNSVDSDGMFQSLLKGQPYELPEVYSDLNPFY